ncbi:hypothetical protein SU32_15955 [Ahrensia marina]|uniref:Uncharacterized protein n=1 Tax=Ahrensia marina TaxID=1514904 RepID=A0A0N0VKY6_9HYPH|nr:hypothetical protein SU32_15955 [Ahrensia marina]
MKYNKMAKDTTVPKINSVFIKKRRERNFLVLVVLFALVGGIFASSFTHIQKETNKISIIN